MRCFTALPLLGVLVSVAHADADEWRLALTGTGAAATLDAGGTSASTFALGGRVAFGYGLSNSVDVAGELSFSMARALEFDGARMQNLSGNLFADLYAGEVSVGATWHAGVGVSRAFASTHPFIGLRGGALLRVLGGQELLTPNNMLILDAGTDVAVLPFVGARAGVEHRFGQGFFVALVGDFALASSYRSLGASLQLAWAWY